MRNLVGARSGKARITRDPGADVGIGSRVENELGLLSEPGTILFHAGLATNDRRMADGRNGKFLCPRINQFYRSASGFEGQGHTDRFGLQVALSSEASAYSRAHYPDFIQGQV